MEKLEMQQDLTKEEQIKLISDQRDRLLGDLEKLRKERDSLERRLQNTQNLIQRLENLSSFGESASEIAHEINNPVNFVSGSLNIVKRGIKDFIELMDQYRNLNGIKNLQDYPKIKELEEDIDVELTRKELTDAANIIEKGMERVHEIAHNLSLMGKGENAAALKLNVNQSLADTLTIIKAKVNGQIEMRTEYGQVPEIMSYRGKLNQVFTNILKNAVDAIQAKPVAPNDHILIKTVVDKENVVVTIKDTGVGMTEETLNRLFEKFYTTKTSDEGKGLGMAICKSIVDQHKGKIEISSQKNTGTVVTITLPKNH